MKNFIVAFAISVVLLSCTAEQSKKLDVVEKINENIRENPSAAGSTGTNYYVCDDGDDANDGLSETTPWKSFSKGMEKFTRMEAGDAVLFCRGGVFTTKETARIANSKCEASNPCIISDYYNPVSQVADEPPMISSLHSDAVFNFQDGGMADHDEGYFLENFNIQGLGADQGTAFLFYNDVDDVWMQNVTISSFRIGVYIGGANEPSVGSNSYNERITGSNVFRGNNVAKFVIGVGDEYFLENLVTTTVEEPVILKDEVIANTGGTYFVCGTGSDENDGLSPSTPWRTFTRAMWRFNLLQAGESINFCRGDVFYDGSTSRLANYNCTADNKCRIGDYYADVDSISAGLERPKIINADGAKLFDFQDGGNADQDGGYLIENLILESVTANSAAIYLYNDVDDLTIRNVKIDGFKVGINAQGTNALNEGSNKQNERIIFENNQVVNNASQGWLGSCSDCEIRFNYFENNGYNRVMLDHNLYFSAHDATNVLIANNTLKKSTNINGICQGVSLVMHGVGKNITIENNLIEEEANKAWAGCWGIAVDTGYSTEESFEHLIIRGNTVINTGNLGIGCSSCVDVLIENNTIINENDMNFTGVSVPNRSEDTLKSSGIVVQNNKVVLSSSSNKVKKGFSINPQDGNFTVNNNEVHANYNEVVCATLINTDEVAAEQCVIIKN